MPINYSNYLPQDILIKILHFLPFVSILECKCVSKDWKSLINDPKFYNLYHDKSLTLFISKGSLYCLLIRHDGSKSVHHIPIDGRAQGLVLESSNAVACVGLANNHFLLYNLFTGASHNVVDAPIASLQIPLGFSTGWIYYGFGYDHYADDHKILVVSNYGIQEWMGEKMKQKFDMNMVQKKDNSLFWVYNFRNHAWKTLQGFPCADYSQESLRRACSINGILHWVCPKRGGDPMNVILTYDLHTSMFAELSEVPAHKGILATSLIELGGQLCYSIRDVYGVHTHVWVMKEYGVYESWTKLFSLDMSKLITDGLSRNVIALYESHDGRKIVLIVCYNRARLICYDIQHGSAEVVEYDVSWKVRPKLSMVGVKR